MKYLHYGRLVVICMYGIHFCFVCFFCFWEIVGLNIFYYENSLFLEGSSLAQQSTKGDLDGFKATTKY